MTFVYTLLFGLAICAVVMVIAAIGLTPVIERRQVEVPSQDE